LEVVFALPSGAAEPLPIAVPLPGVAAAWPAFKPPFRPPPGVAVWLRPPASERPLPVVPGIASPPDDPVCGADPAMPEGPPGGPSGATGVVVTVALPVPGLPGAFGFEDTSLLHAPRPRAHTAATLASSQLRCAIAQREAEAAPVLPEALEPVVPEVPEEPLVPPAPEPVVPPAPIEVPLPVLPVVPPMAEPVPVVEPAPVVVSVLPPVAPVVPPAPPVPEVPIEPEPVVPPAVVLLVVSLGEVVVDGVVLDEDDEVEPAPAPASFFLPQADRDRAAIRARAAHCAIGDLIMGTPSELSR
jgi:hypothetical protein